MALIKEYYIVCDICGDSKGSDFVNPSLLPNNQRKQLKKEYAWERRNGKDICDR